MHGRIEASGAGQQHGCAGHRLATHRVVDHAHRAKRQARLLVSAPAGTSVSPMSVPPRGSAPPGLFGPIGAGRDLQSLLVRHWLAAHSHDSSAHGNALHSRCRALRHRNDTSRPRWRSGRALDEHLTLIQLHDPAFRRRLIESRVRSWSLSRQIAPAMDRPLPVSANRQLLASTAAGSGCPGSCRYRSACRRRCPLCPVASW